MKPLTVHRGRVVPLDRTSVDTDVIIPGKHCLTVKRTGFADHLFDAWRGDPDFPLDSPERRGASILIAGADFGTGSSREHAVWALQDWGFRVVIASRFGDIFYNNCAKAGLVAARVDEHFSRELRAESAARPNLLVTVDLISLEVEWEDASGNPRTASIDMDPYTQRRFIEGLDDIDLTLRHHDAIAAYEEENLARLPRPNAEAGLR